MGMEGRDLQRRQEDEIADDIIVRVGVHMMIAIVMGIIRGDINVIVHQIGIADSLHHQPHLDTLLLLWLPWIQQHHFARFPAL